MVRSTELILEFGVCISLFSGTLIWHGVETAMVSPGMRDIIKAYGQNSNQSSNLVLSELVHQTTLNCKEIRK